MMYALKDNKEWIELKATLQFVEDKINRITDNHTWVSKKELTEQVKELLSDRHFILGKMFRLHVTEQEVVRFREVNDHLLELTRKMFGEHMKLLESLKGNPVLSVTNWDDVVVEMFDAIVWTEDLEIHSCCTTLGEKPEPDHLDNSSRWSWAEGCLDVPQFEGIGVCYAIHDLCTHKNYTVPDLLRIRSYSLQNIITGNWKHIVS